MSSDSAPVGSGSYEEESGPCDGDPGRSPSEANVQSSASREGPASNGMEGLLGPIEEALQAACQFGQGCPPRLGDAIRYAVLAPGKRLRPALTLMAAEACGGSWSAAMPGAVAVEMIHAYSLIHDDLPAMDDDDLRRGRPTVHVAFDEATAILAGDALQAEAFTHLTTHVADPVAASRAVAVLAGAAGASRLVGGQADDLAAEKRAAEGDSGPTAQGNESDPKRSGFSELEQLEAIHRRKTGALFSASLELGAILSGASEGDRKALVDYAEDLGLAFQVVDDLLDFTSTAATLGKRAGKDAERGKLTYPGLMGLEAARSRAQGLVATARDHVAVFGALGWRLTWLADYVLEREH